MLAKRYEDGKIRCGYCGQLLDEEQKRCPICKAKVDGIEDVLPPVPLPSVQKKTLTKKTWILRIVGWALVIIAIGIDVLILHP